MTPPPGVRGLDTVGTDIAAVVAARAAGLVVAAATVVLTTRLLGPAGYAQVALASVLAMLVFTVGSAWTAAAVTRYGRGELEQRSTLRHTSWARLVLTAPLVAAGCLAVGVAGAAGLFPPELGTGLVVVALASGVLLIASEHLVVVLEAAGRMRTSAVAVVLRGLLVAAALGCVALLGADVSAQAVVAIGAAASAVLTVGTAALVWRLAVWPVVLDRAAVRRIWLFSLPMIAFSASQYGMRSVDVVILRVFEPAATVGVYAIAFQAFVMLTQLTTTITIVVTPLFVSLRHAGREHELSRFLARLVPQATLAVGIAVGIAAPVAVLAVPIVFGSAFEDAADPVVILLAALWIRAVASLVAPVLMLHERSGATAVINIVALAVNMAGDLLLVGALGLGVIGPAIASVLAMLPIAAGYLLVASRAVGSRPRFPLAVAVAPVAGVAAALTLPAGIALLVALAAAGAGAGLALAAGLVSAEDADLIDRLRLPPALRRRLIRGG